MPKQLTDEYLDAGMRGCIVNMAKKHCYRIAGHDIDDLIQEGYYIYYKCRMRYVGQRPTRKPDGTLRRALPVRKPDKQARKHLMSLVKMSFRNHLITLAEKQPAAREALMCDMIRPDQIEENVWDQLMPPEQELATVTSLLQSAPKEIKQLLTLLVTDALEATSYLRRGTKMRGGRPVSPRETNNEYYCRALGLPTSYNVEYALTRHFLG